MIRAFSFPAQMASRRVDVEEMDPERAKGAKGTRS
jgi:hypothetical protein